VQKCVEKGADVGWLNNKYCDAGCVNGECVSTSCTPGDKRCSGNFKQECSILGKWENKGDRCQYGCKEVSEVPVCKSPGCTADEKRCNPDNQKQVQKCNVAGKWGTFKTCTTGCDPETNECLGVIAADCDIGGWRCGTDNWNRWVQRCVYKASTYGWWNEKYCGDDICGLVNGKPDCIKAET
jgi:hypothetical protein